MTERSGKPQHISDILPRAIEALEIENWGPSRLCERWLEIAGALAGRHSRPAGVRGGVLTVEVDSSVWLSELTLLRPELEKRIAEIAPIVKKIRLRLASR